MKTKFLLILCLLLNVISLVAQNKVDVSATNANPISDESGRFAIYWATYEEWGHGIACTGWGLCNFSDCWFCEVNDKHRAKVLIDKETKQGEMLIELDPVAPDEKKAIEEKTIFIVEENINNTNSVLYQGNYGFDKTVGKYGGYRLKISLK